MQWINRFFKGRSPKSTIAMGQSGILATLLLSAAFLGLVPDRQTALIDGRIALGEIIATNTSILITHSDQRRMEANLRLAVERNEQLLSAAIRREDGKSIANIGEHEGQWHGDSNSTDQLAIPIWEGDAQWGQLELRFTPMEASGWLSFAFDPLFQLISFMVFLSYIAFYFYLGKMLKDLDPSQAIPGRVRSALDTMAEGLLVLDTKQNIVLANEAFASIVDQSPDKLIGKRIEKFDWTNGNEEDAPNGKQPWSLALSQGEAQTNNMVRLQQEGMKTRTFLTNCSPVLGNSGKAGGVLISFDDVTELEEKEIELRRSKEDAEYANRAKSDFLANMSHEIRSPMNAIMGFTEVLKRGVGQGTGTDLRYLNIISGSARHLLDLIDDILDLSKVEAGHIDVEVIPCAAHNVIHEVVNIMSVKAEEKGIGLTYTPNGPLPELIESDPSRLRQIITNLVGNAIKFTESGSVKIVSRLEKNAAQPCLTFKVIDTGIGMTEEQCENVFDSFVQADSSITRRFGGSGLGLTISKQFAEALGGDISVRSEQGEGSTFTLTVDVGDISNIPLLSAEELLVDERLKVAGGESQWHFEPAKVLVVDDGLTNRELIKVVLEEAGLQVDAAESGIRAMNMVKAQSYDIVLLDIQMPVMDGFTTVAKMRSAGLTIPVTALTAHAMKGVEEKCMQAGYTGYLSKPIDLDKLLDHLAEQLEAEKRPCKQRSKREKTADVRPETNLNPQNTIRSTLPKSEKFQSLIKQFIEKLGQQLHHMEQLIGNSEGEELADLAHWLKGSAGTAGFDAFTEPALQLEQAAKDLDFDQARTELRQIWHLYYRTEVASTPLDMGNLDHTQMLPTLTNTIQSGQKPSSSGENLRDSAYTIPKVVVSTLPAGNSNFDSLIVQFAERLDEQLGAIENALKIKDFDAIAELAHWLKGSAGTVGFDEFTQPAIELESSSKMRNEEETSHNVAMLNMLNKRISVNADRSVHSLRGQ